DQGDVIDVTDEQGNAEHRRLVAVAQVVEHHHVSAMAPEGADGVGSDVARTASDENRHRGRPRSLRWTPRTCWLPRVPVGCHCRPPPANRARLRTFRRERRGSYGPFGDAA